MKNGLPPALRPWFHGYPFEALNLEEHRSLVIERILRYGDRAEVRWLVRQYGKAAIADWLVARGAKLLPWRRHRLWCVAFETPLVDRSPVRVVAWPH